jgi:hypothetical protein
MKFFLCACAAVFLGLSAPSARAADITGVWNADMQMPGGGDNMQIAFTFKQDGAVLSGSVQGPQGDAMAISDGKIDGDKISFKVSFNGMTITHEGTINGAGDEIKLSSKSDSGDFPAMEMTLKRAKPAPAYGIIAAPPQLRQFHAGL